MSIDALSRFISQLQRYGLEDAPRRGPGDSTAVARVRNVLPPMFQVWLERAPRDIVRFGGTDIAGSLAGLAEYVQLRGHDLPSGMIPFGWAEDMGADLCFDTSNGPLGDEDPVLARDHEDGRLVNMGSFAELVEAWSDGIDDLIEFARRFE